MRNRIFRFSISGPDGSGKSTLCEEVNSQLVSSEVIHAVKDRNLRLMSTKLGVKLLKFAESKNQMLYTLVLYLIYYPLEFLENLKRFSVKGKDNYLYDRHPIDRMALKYEFLLRYRKGKVKKVRFFIEYPFRVFWSEIYRLIFIRIDRIYILLPDPELSFVRASGQYEKIEDAVYKMESYKMSAKRYSKLHNLQEVFVGEKDSIERIVSYLLDDIDKLKKNRK